MDLLSRGPGGCVRIRFGLKADVKLLKDVFGSFKTTMKGYAIADDGRRQDFIDCKARPAEA